MVRAAIAAKDIQEEVALQLSIGLMTFRLVRSPFKAVSVHSITTLDTC